MSLNVSFPDGLRLAAALDELRSGGSLEHEGVGMVLRPDGALEYSVAASWRPENVTGARAREDLRIAAAAVERLEAASAGFAALVRGRPRVGTLVYDYGTGAVALCSLRDGELTWAPGAAEIVRSTVPIP